MSKWFMPVGETAAKIDKIIKDRNAIQSRAVKLMKQVGATGFRAQLGNFVVEGFDFAAEPDRERWKFVRKAFWAPKKSTNKHIWTAMAGLTHETKHLISEVIGFRKLNIVAKHDRFVVESFGWNTTKSGQLILEMPDRFKEIKGCKRISDLHAEQLCKKPSREG